MLQINWESFKAYNQDTRGVRYKFEDLCRQLFANENLSGNKLFRYLHANPNNAGLETEPIYNESNKCWVGFQAKFFDDNVDYSKIKQSAEKIAKYYNGNAGKLDIVYLFCNKPITSTAKPYVDTINILKAAGIELQLVTDNTILDLVRNRYPYLGLYYFGNHNLSFEWFIKHNGLMFDELGERYSRELNVETKSFDELSLFVRDERAVACINDKKKIILERIQSLFQSHYNYNDYLKNLYNVVINLPDITIESFDIVDNWVATVESAVQPQITELSIKLKKLRKKFKEKDSIPHGEAESVDEHNSTKKAYRELQKEIDDLTLLIELPEMLKLTEREKLLLSGKILLLSGNAGTGKSHLLASQAAQLQKEDRTVLFLVAGIYYDTGRMVPCTIKKTLQMHYNAVSEIALDIFIISCYYSHNRYN